jgi:hypothetical protein
LSLRCLSSRSLWRLRSSDDECTESSSPRTIERLEAEVTPVPASSPPAAPDVACAASATPLWERRKRSPSKVARPTQLLPPSRFENSELPSVPPTAITCTPLKRPRRRDGGPAGAAQQAVSCGVRKCEPLAQRLPHSAAAFRWIKGRSRARAGSGGLQRVQRTGALSGHALATEVAASSVRTQSRHRVTTATDSWCVKSQGLSTN